MKAQKGKKVGPESKATGVVVSRKDEKANPDDFKYLRKSEKAASEKALKSKGKPKAKNGKSFPDLNKDGKITKADILKGRGVIAKKGSTVKKTMKSGGKMSKCKNGCK